MSKAISHDAMMQVLPGVLDQDEGMRRLAELIATGDDGIITLAEAAGIFTRIDELPEKLLDILAKDLNIIWYEKDKSLAVKRAQVKSAWYIHRHLGTVGSVKQALSDVWPPSSVEEWFEYGGDPYSFRIILDATGSTGTVRVTEAIRAVEKYKPARAHLDGAPITQLVGQIIIDTEPEGGGSVTTTYKVRKCGTPINALF